MSWFFRMRRQREQELNEEIAFDLAADTKERVEMGVQWKASDIGQIRALPSGRHLTESASKFRKELIGK